MGPNSGFLYFGSNFLRKTIRKVDAAAGESRCMRDYAEASALPASIPPQLYRAIHRGGIH